MGSSHSRTTRRDFLSGKSAARAAQDLLPDDASEAGPSDPLSARDSYLVQVGRAAMACDFDVFLNAGQHPNATESAIEALDLVDALESQMTIYRATSEILEINRRAADGPVAVEQRLFGLLQQAVDLHASTGGAFDITSGPLSKVWGFLRREGRLPDESEIADAKSRVGSQWLELDAVAFAIRFLRQGIEINLNAIGKGYALDRCAELLTARGIEDFLIHGGKSSVLARGTRALSDTTTPGWLVSVKHPSKPTQTLAELVLQNKALGTSGTANQYFHFQGMRYGHLIDPRTGWPTDEMLSATVLAPTAAEADALATAMFVMGVDESVRFCASRPELACICVRPGERSGEIELHVCGLCEDQWRIVTNTESNDVAIFCHQPQGKVGESSLGVVDGT